MPMTQWIPSELIDERQPPLRDTPSDWIVTGEDGEPALSDGDDGIAKPLSDNDVVNFCSCTIFGTGVLELKSPDQWTVDHGMPREASKVCATNIFDIDTGANSLNEFVEGIIEQRTERGEEELIPDEYEVSYYTYSDDMPHRFDRAKRSFALAVPDNR